MKLLPLAVVCFCLIGLPARSAHAQAAEWEGAIGATVHHGPRYAGADEARTRAEPSVFLRWGRYSISNSAGFVTRKQQDVTRGLGVALVEHDALQLDLGLRIDGGRREEASPALDGLGSVRKTVRAQLSARYGFEAFGMPWRATLAWSIDALGRGGGGLGEAKMQRDWRFSADTVVSGGASLRYGTRRWQQSWFGVTPEQAARSGYPVYTPRAGLRDVSLFASVNHNFNERWVGMAGASISSLLGPAADSPLTRRSEGVGLSAGLAWRF